MADDGKESEWDDVAEGSVEWQRCILVSTIILCDISIIVQDWEFPTFDSSLSASIKIPGLSVSEIDFKFMGWFRQTRLFAWIDKTDFFDVKITGKWIAYGPLMVILCLDLNCARNQFLYEPVNYGQYAEADSHQIWTITEGATLSSLYDGVQVRNRALVTWEARAGRVTDCMSSR